MKRNFTSLSEEDADKNVEKYDNYDEEDENDKNDAKWEEETETEEETDENEEDGDDEEEDVEDEKEEILNEKEATPYENGREHAKEGVNDQDFNKGFIKLGIECKEIIKRVYPEFNFQECILQLATHPIPVKHHDYDEPIIKGSKYTKGNWANSFLAIIEDYVIPKEAEDALLNNIFNAFNNVAAVPAKLTETGRYNIMMKRRKQLLKFANDRDKSNDSSSSDDEVSLSDKNATSALRDYTSHVTRWIKFDSCIDDCNVFVGHLGDQFYCPKNDCHKPRFRPCSNSHCKTKGTATCKHLLINGTAYKTVYYRPLVPLLLDLVETKFFVTALNYQNDCIVADDDLFYKDLSDGTVPPLHLKEMQANFENWKSKDPINRAKVIAVNILISEFYDGGKLFDKKPSKFWGLFSSILNLPPTYRGKIGVSTFLSAIYGGDHKKAESFFFIDCYCEELRVLYEGYEHFSRTSNNRYFIQARLICHTLDSRAQEAVFKIMSMSNSRFGCWLCRLITGIHDSYRCLYVGNRHTLPLKHPLRFFGQSAKCCPSLFYCNLAENQWFIDEGFQNNHTPISAHGITQDLKGQIKNKINAMQYCSPCDGNFERDLEIRQFLLNNKSSEGNFVWAHNDIDPEFKYDYFNAFGKLRDFIFYRHFDFRPQKLYSRITKDDHMKAALEARNANEKYEARWRIKNMKAKKLLKQVGRRTKKPDTIKVDGFYDVWAFARLPYADLPKHSTPPLDHAIGGVVSRMCSYMFGSFKEKAISKKANKEKAKSSTNKKKGKTEKKKNLEEGDDVADESKPVQWLPIYRPSFANIGAPYCCSSPLFEFCNASLQCALIPVGISTRHSSYKVNLNQMGYVKLDEHKKLVSVYWDFILSIVDIGPQYKILFGMMGAFLTELMAWNIPKISVDKLQERINEILSLWEALLPAKENYYQLHQLMDLVSSIPLFGRIPGELSGERALGNLKNIKKKSNPGGVSFEGMITRRHVDREMRILKKFYDTDPINVKVISAPNHISNVFLDSTNDILYHRNFCFEILKPEKTLENEIDSLENHEINKLISLIHKEIRKVFNGDVELCKLNSSLYLMTTTNMDGRLPRFGDFWSRFEHITDPKNAFKFSAQEILIASNFLNFKPEFYSKALIYGLPFRSRGSKHREIVSKSTNWGGTTKTDRKDLKWSDKRSFSSWCIFQQSDYGQTYSRKHYYRYGKINCFFKIKVGDAVTDEIIVASMTTFRFIRKDGIDKVEAEDSLQDSISFVALQDIYPTLISEIPYTKSTSSNGKVEYLPVL